jgi:hypothetical protein
MLALKHPHERDADIDMRAEDHTYTIKGECDYESCTTVVKNYFAKFDADGIIDRMMAKPDWPSSKYYGMTKEEIKDMWTRNGQAAAQYGTDMHALIEDHYNGMYRVVDEPEYAMFLDFLQDHAHMVPFRTEMKVYDEDIKVCGTIDMLFLNPEDGTLSIYDWKFSKEIQYKNNFKKKALAPLQHLDDCNVVHYSLQLNLYRTILERKYGFNVRDLALVFMHRNHGTSYVKVSVPFMDAEMKAVYETKGYALV